MIFRWVRADEAPVPATRVVPFDAVAAELPAGTPRVDPRSRRRAVAARRAGIERRYPR